ncbi:MAG: site-specific integrase, partial [Dehalococcoidia bacterium]
MKHVDDYLAQQMVSKRADSQVGKALTPRTKQYHRAILRRALNVGIKWGWVSQNVVRATDAVAQVKRELPALSIADSESLMEAPKADTLADLYLVGLWTGLRVGEVAGIKWEDLDLDAGRRQVRRQVQRIEGVLQLVEPKTQASKAAIDLQPDVIEMFQRRAAAAINREWLVFVTKSGRPYDPVYITHRLQAALRKAGREPIPFHHLRHYFFSFLPQLGVHPAVAQRLARHASITTTKNVYTG